VTVGSNPPPGNRTGIDAELIVLNVAMPTFRGDEPCVILSVNDCAESALAPVNVNEVMSSVVVRLNT